MVAGLAMQGYGDEALKLFHQMEDSGIKPDGITFISILYACSHAGLIEDGCACSIHGNVELAEEVQSRLSELDPSDSEKDHVLLSNIYAVAGKWKDVATVRKSMNSQGLTKTPGWSMTRKSGQFACHSFVAEVIGSVLHDIEDEEKEDSLVTHSEKLALAFGMSRLCDGSIIRIVKNLRVCKDCHTVMKLVSNVFGIEIVLRDRSRFHSFRDGSCSCKDYW
ncbi:pentatricopeptide repeat-containing protein [Tanacetum coccineum]